jgi:lysozyme family protein
VARSADRDQNQLDRILTREGGWVDRAEDKGGPTNYGVTQAVWTEWLAGKKGVPTLPYPASVKAITVEMARRLYLDRYLAPFKGIVNDDLFDLAVDTGVNHGRGRSALWLQRAAGVLEDGSIGPITLAKVNARPITVYFDLCALRVKAYGALISQNHSQAIFAAGWMNRVAEFIARDVFAPLVF